MAHIFEFIVPNRETYAIYKQEQYSAILLLLLL